MAPFTTQETETCVYKLYSNIRLALEYVNEYNKLEL